MILRDVIADRNHLARSAGRMSPAPVSSKTKAKTTTKTV